MSRTRLVPTLIAAAVLTAGISSAALADPTDATDTNQSVTAVTTSYAGTADQNASLTSETPTAGRPPFAPIHSANKALAERRVILEEMNWYYS